MLHNHSFDEDQLQENRLFRQAVAEADLETATGTVPSDNDELLQEADSDPELDNGGILLAQELEWIEKQYFTDL